MLPSSRRSKPLVIPVKQEEIALVLGDLHIPFENRRALSLVERVGKIIQPDYFFLNGDVTDCWEISRFDKNPRLESEAALRTEISRTKQYLKSLRSKFPTAKIKWLYGNHEYRWEKYILANAKPLHGLSGLSLAEQVDAEALRIDVINSGNKENSYLFGNLLIGHFDRVHKHSGYTARNLLEDKGISLIQNHTHRGGATYKRAYDRDLVGYENFCLCDRNPAYVDHPNWQLGFSVVHRDLNSDFFYVEQHPIIETETAGELVYKCFFNGQYLLN